MSETSPAQRKWIQILHVAKRECGLTDDEYSVLLEGAAGVTSARDIKSWKQYDAALRAFKKIGFKIQTKTSVKTGFKEPITDTQRNREFISAKQEYYIKGLWDLASKKKDELSLRRMIKRIGHVDDIRFLKRRDATDVIIALRDIAKKAGYHPDNGYNNT